MNKIHWNLIKIRSCARFSWFRFSSYFTGSKIFFFGPSGLSLVRSASAVFTLLTYNPCSSYELGNIKNTSSILHWIGSSFQFRSLGRNPFKCDCNLEWLRRRLLGLHEHFPRLLHVETIKCATPANLEGRTLVNLSKDVLCGKDSKKQLLWSLS